MALPTANAGLNAGNRRQSQTDLNSAHVQAKLERGGMHAFCTHRAKATFL